ncbi:MAG TPA: FtsX-like permease family protein [Myxococcales bacterium]|nr:FtsX-like permease family protein [Myxococcales bacterium]
MTSGSLFRLASLSLRRDRRGAAFSAFGVGIGVGALVFFVALGSGVGRVVRDRVFPTDASLVDVIPPTLSLGSILGGGKLDQATVDRLAALPQVAVVYRRMQVRVPGVSRYEGDFFGSHLRMGVEVLAVGVDPGLVQGDVQLGDFSDPGPGHPIPAVMASRLLEIYNKSFAPARHLPQLSGSMLVGFVFPVEFNRSYVAQTAAGPVSAAQAQVVGVSDRGLLAGLTIPLETARRINRSSGADADTYTGVALQAKDPSLVPALIDEVKRMGLQIDDQERKLAESTGAAVAVTTSALALLSVLICALAAVNIAHALFAQVRARSREIGIMRAVGASRADVQRLILAEAAAVGASGGLLGTAGAVGLALLVDALASGYLPPFPFKPDTFFHFSPALLGGGVLLGLVAALAGAYLPSRRAARMDPARALAG